MACLDKIITATEKNDAQDSVEAITALVMDHVTFKLLIKNLSSDLEDKFLGKGDLNKIQNRFVTAEKLE